MNSSFAGYLGWEHRLVPCKGIQDSPGYWSLRRGFRIPKPRIRNSGFEFPCMARALGLRQIHLLSFSSQRWGRLFESIAKSSALQDGWGRSNCVIIHVDLYFSGWHWRILWDRDRGLDHSTLPYSRVNSKCRWERIVKTDFGLKLVIEKSLFLVHKMNMWSAQPLTP